MHDVLTLMYCCGVSTPRPTPHWWFQAMTTMCDIVVPGHPSLEYFEDPIVIISFFHSQFEPSTLDMTDIIGRFMHDDADVSTSVWGPAAWNVLHNLARGERFTHVRDLLYCWKSALPCDSCRRHLGKHLEHTRFNHTTSSEAHDYTVMLHNAVNCQLDKPLYVQEP